MLQKIENKERFRKYSQLVTEAVGHPNAFILAVVTIVIWLLTGPYFNYSDTWQMVINTSTTIITFLIVFLIQNSQNRDSRAVHLKLDELIRAVKGARTELVSLEDLTEDELEKLHQEFKELHTKISAKLTTKQKKMKYI